MTEFCRHDWGFSATHSAIMSKRHGEPHTAECPCGFVIDCSFPNILRCSSCEAFKAVACNTSNADRCQSCALKYVGRVSQVARSGVRVGVEGLFLTLTAPGETEHFLPNGKACPCTPPAVGGVPATDFAEWNMSLSKRWNHFLKDLSRLGGFDLFDDAGNRIQGLIYFRAVEVQKRGVLHLHVLLKHRLNRPLSLGLSLVRELAIKHGFGHSVDLQRLDAGHASYVAKYASKSASNSRRSVIWAKEKEVNKIVVSESTGEVFSFTVIKEIPCPTFRTWTKSRLFGLSMKQIKLDQQHFLLVLLALPSWENRQTSLAWSTLAVPKAPL